MIYLSFPSISPVFFSIGPLDIRWYSLAYIVGFIFAWRYIKYLASNKAVSHSNSINEKLIDDLIFYSIIGLIIGARLGYVIFYNYDYYSENLIEILYLWQGGLSFHGGLLGIVIAAIIISKLYKTTFFEISDLICVSAPVGIFFGRISNFINGELFGRPSNFLIGMKFPNADNQYRHPSQLYEAFLEGLLLFIILNFLIFKFKKLKNPGIISGVFLMLYGLFRFTVEFTREPDIQLGFVYHFLTMGMILSLPMFLAGILILAINKNNILVKKKEISIKDIKNENFILFPKSKGALGIYDKIIEFCKKANFEPKVIQEAYEIEVILGLVSGGLGVALIPENSGLIRLNKVVFKKFLEKAPKSEIYLIMRNNDLNPLTNNFFNLGKKSNER